MQAKETTIRTGTGEDGPQLARLSLAVWTSLKSLVPEGFLERLNYEAQTEKYRQRASDPDWIFLVACVDDRIVGMIGAKDNDSEPANFEKQIKAMYVHPDCQRCGIGSKLLRRMITELSKRHVKNVMLWCISANTTAASFYEKHGGRRLENVKPPDEFSLMPHVVYAWDSLSK